MMLIAAKNMREVYNDKDVGGKITMEEITGKKGGEKHAGEKKQWQGNCLLRAKRKFELGQSDRAGRKKTQNSKNPRGLETRLCKKGKYTLGREKKKTNHREKDKGRKEKRRNEEEKLVKKRVRLIRRIKSQKKKLNGQDQKGGKKNAEGRGRGLPGGKCNKFRLKRRPERGGVQGARGRGGKKNTHAERRQSSTPKKERSLQTKARGGAPFLRKGRGAKKAEK